MVTNLTWMSKGYNFVEQVFDPSIFDSARELNDKREFRYQLKRNILVCSGTITGEKYDIFGIFIAVCTWLFLRKTFLLTSNREI